MFNGILAIFFTILGISIGILYNKFVIKDYPDYKRNYDYFNNYREYIYINSFYLCYIYIKYCKKREEI